MEIKKVKEIKKALEDHSINKLKYQDGIKIKELDFADILTLINELESENERFIEERDLYKSQFNELEPRFFDLMWDNNELKDLIAKLEKDRAELKCSLSKKTMEYELLKCGKAIGKGIVEVATKTKEKLELLEFAERLKKKLEESNCINNGLWLVDTQVLIDETLKEFIK